MPLNRLILSIVTALTALTISSSAFAFPANFPEEMMAEVKPTRRIPLSTKSPINRYCRSAYVNLFRVTGVKDFSIKTNYCAVPLSKVPKKVKATLDQLRATHIQIASFLATDVKTLFRRGISITLKGTAIGFYASAYAGPAILGPGEGFQIGVFPTWKSGKINVAVYTHEFAHSIALGTLKSFEALQEVGDQDLFQEGIADELAVALYGSISTDVDGVPACVSNVREFNSEKTFNAPKGEFDLVSGARRRYACCSNLQTQGLLAGDAKKLCELIIQAVSKKPFPPYKTEQFDPSLGHKAKPGNYSKPEDDVYDTHELGVPIVSFLNDLRKEYSYKGSPLYKTLAAFTSLDTFKRDYTCSLENQPGASVDELGEFSVSQVFTKMRELFVPIDNGEKFDELFAKHGIERGLAFGEKILLSTSGAAFDIYDQMQSNANSVFNQNNRCYSPELSTYLLNTDCEFECTAKPL